MVFMRPETAAFFAIYIAGLAAARPLASNDLEVGDLPSAGSSVLNQYTAASSTVAPMMTPAANGTTRAHPTGSIDLEAGVSKVLAVAAPLFHVTSLPQIPTFLGVPAAQETDIASKIVAAAQPSITSNPVLMDVAVAGALGVAGKYLSTTTQSGSTIVGLPASDLPKCASEIVGLLPANIKSAGASALSAAATKLPSGVLSDAQSLETLLPSNVQGDINNLLGGASATPTPTAYASKRGLLSDVEAALGVTTSSSATSSSTSSSSSKTTSTKTTSSATSTTSTSATSTTTGASASDLLAAAQSKIDAAAASQLSSEMSAAAAATPTQIPDDETPCTGIIGC